jgi:hypothetical protein
MDNYNTFELILLYMTKKDLVKLTRINKSWLNIIHTNQILWSDFPVKLEYNTHQKIDEYDNISGEKWLVYPIQILDCNVNRNIINVSHLPLKRLDCGYNNCITNSEIKKCKSLQYLSCGRNYHITDDGIKDLQLIYLACGVNQNITNEGIKNLKLIRLDLCENNKIDDIGILSIINTLRFLKIGFNTNITNKTKTLLQSKGIKIS